jgi:hypothetical protein
MTDLRARALSARGLAVLLAVVVVLGGAVWRGAGALGLTRSDNDRFADVCRTHGGTPSLARGSGDYVKDARSCVIRYGAHTYEMYAVTPQGFDEQEVVRARRACEDLARNDRTLPESAGVPQRRVWHPGSAICEAQP